MKEAQELSNKGPSEPQVLPTGQSQTPPNTTSVANGGMITKTAPSPATTANTKEKVIFDSSVIGIQTARKEDAFAEHKRRDAEKKARQKTNLHKALIIGSIVLVLGIIITVLLIILLPHSDNGEMTAEAEEKRTEQNQAIFNDVYDEATKKEEEGDNEETVNEVFTEAVNSATTSSAANAARVSQMRYLLEDGNYEEVIKIGEETGDDQTEPCEDATLGLDLRISCHNILGLSYFYIDEHAKSDFHMARVRELIDERITLQRNGGGE